MKNFKNNIIIFSILSVILLVGCSADSSTDEVSGEGSEKRTIKIANFYADDHAVNIALNEKFKTIVEEESNGSLEVEVYSNSQLGGEEQMWDSVKNGTLEMAEIGVVMESEVPMIGILTLPFLFESYDHAQKVLQGSVGDQIGEQLEEKAPIEFLGYGINGFRSFSSNKPIEKMEDFKGYRLRSANIPQLLQMSEDLGATVTPMAISEIFTGLEQGVVDGQENPISSLRSNGWYEVQSHVLESQHVFLPNTIMINREFWESLTSEQQDVIQNAVDASAEYEWELFIENEEDDKNYLEEQDLTIIVPDEDFRNQMIDATKGVYDSFYEKNDWGEEIIDEIESAK